jgi:hypothetical protein
MAGPVETFDALMEKFDGLSDAVQGFIDGPMEKLTRQVEKFTDGLTGTVKTLKGFADSITAAPAAMAQFVGRWPPAC